MGKAFLLAVAILGLAGCVGATLTPEGSLVSIIEPNLIDSKACKSLGTHVYQTVSKDQGAYKSTVLIDLKNHVALKNANVATTAYPLRDGGLIQIGTPISYEAWDCPYKFRESLRPIE